MDVHQAVLVRKRTVVHHIQRIGKGISQRNSLQVDLKLSLAHRLVLDVLLVNLMGNTGNVFARKRLARDKEGTLAVLGEQSKELNEGDMEVIADCLNGLGVAVGIGEAEAGAHGVVDEDDRVVLVPAEGVFCKRNSVFNKNDLFDK